MPFSKAILHLILWILLLGLLNWGASFFYPADGYTTKFSWLTYVIFGIISISALVFAKLIMDINPKQNLTTVVFGIFTARFIFTMIFFCTYYLLANPKGQFFIVPFMLMFAYYLVIENIYLLKYTNYVDKNSKNTTTT